MKHHSLLLVIIASLICVSGCKHTPQTSGVKDVAANLGDEENPEWYLLFPINDGEEYCFGRCTGIPQLKDLDRNGCRQGKAQKSDELFDYIDAMELTGNVDVDMIVREQFKTYSSQGQIHEFGKGTIKKIEEFFASSNEECNTLDGLTQVESKNGTAVIVSDEKKAVEKKMVNTKPKRPSDAESGDAAANASPTDRISCQHEHGKPMCDILEYHVSNSELNVQNVFGLIRINDALRANSERLGKWVAFYKKNNYRVTVDVADRAKRAVTALCNVEYKTSGVYGGLAVSTYSQLVRESMDSLMWLQWNGGYSEAISCK